MPLMLYTSKIKVPPLHAFGARLAGHRKYDASFSFTEVQAGELSPSRLLRASDAPEAAMPWRAGSLRGRPMPMGGTGEDARRRTATGDSFFAFE